MLFTTVLAVAFLPPLPPAADEVAAARKALPLLVKAALGHAEQRTCFACHNQTFPMMAFATARTRGLDFESSADADTRTAQSEHIVRFLATNREKFRKGEGTGGQVDTAGYAMLALELAGYKPDENTEAVVEYLLKTQSDRDHWRTGSSRPPSEASNFTPTWLALRALRFWSNKDQQPRAAKRLEAARTWLLKTKAKDTEDRVFRLFGLKEAGVDETALAAAAWDLVKTQRADGGWAQLDSMDSDPYATATALVALHQAGGLDTDHPVYVRGVAFLLKGQLPDGSWLVTSRSKPFQKYYESGFPHGKDQFISVATTGWATTALLLTRPAKP